MTKAEAWKQRRDECAVVEELVLPSGMVVKARRPGPEQLMYWGLVPASIVAGVRAETQQKQLSDLTQDEMVGIALAQRDLLVWCLVEPRISLDPKSAEEIHPRDVPSADWQFVRDWAMRVEEGRALMGFRGQRPDAGRSGDSEAVGSAAEPNDGADGSGIIAGL